jgi:hypothetical protein
VSFVVPMPASPADCLVLVPLYGPLAPRCEDGLRELERRGYTVRRVRGFSAVDQGRNQMASDALHSGVAETMWIDPDIGFEADDVERLRGHGLPLVAGIYPQPGSRSLACHLLPGTKKLTFGQQGGLVEIDHAAAGFLHVRREVYETIRERLALPLCNARFGRGVWPFFMPIAVESGGREQASGGREPSEVGGVRSRISQGADAPRSPTVAPRYLTEDYAFSHRARLAGFQIMADTTVRLWRTGSYRFGWEDAGADVERFDTYHFHVE